jgi:hypothetical protein
MVEKWKDGRSNKVHGARRWVQGEHREMEKNSSKNGKVEYWKDREEGYWLLEKHENQSRKHEMTKARKTKVPKHLK